MPYEDDSQNNDLFYDYFERESEHNLNIAKQYAEDIVNGDIVSGEAVFAQCHSFLQDLYDAEENPNCAYRFDCGALNDIIDFAGFCKHYSGPLAGEYIQLEAWQIFYLANIFGWYKKSNNSRRYKYSYLQVARKNGKSTLLAIIALYGLYADGEGGSQVYSFAVTRDQAKIVFDTAKEMIHSSEELSEELVAQERVIKYGPCVFRPMASKTNSLDGLSTHFAILDELHEYPDDTVYNVIKSSTGARKNPHIFIITTAGFSLSSFCFNLRNTLKKVVTGKLDDPSYFAMIYELDKDDDWNDQANWLKANPNLGVSISEEYLQNEYQQALNIPTEQTNFKVKHLNIWQSSQQAWIPDSKWQSKQKEEDEEFLKTCPAFGGLDASATRDLTSFSLIFETGQNQVYAKHWYWLPENKLREKQHEDKNMYELWLQQGYLRVTPGDVVDYETIVYHILELSKQYKIEWIAYDQRFAMQIASLLNKAGVESIAYPQTINYYNVPTMMLEIMIEKDEFYHEENPITRWMMGNVNLHVDYDGRKKPSKDKSSDKIDGVHSMLFALGKWLNDSYIQEEDYIENISPIIWI